MSTQQLRTGILGVGRRAQEIIEAVADMPVWNIQAVADRDLKRAEAVAQRLNCTPFDDYRQFIIQHDFECLLVASPLHLCLEFVRLALKQGIPVLKLPPMARNFEEAAELVELAAANKVRFDVAAAYRYSESFATFQEQLAQEPPEKPFLLRMACNVGLLPPDTPEGIPLHPDHEMAWVTDQAMAGGGVLLHHAYELMDQLIAGFGMPQQVYALCSSQASDKQQLHHLTEDNALMMLRFSERLAGEVVAARYWDDRDHQMSLQVHSRGQVVRVASEEICTCDSRGRCLERMSFSYDRISTLRSLLSAYAQSLLSPQDQPFASDAASQLKVMAVLEAGYLSCRTGAPESPGRIMALVSR